MNCVIELLESNRFTLNEENKHPALFVYNNKTLLSEIEEIIKTKINEKDQIIYLENNNFDSFITDVKSDIDKEYLIINASFRITNKMIDEVINQINKRQNDYIQLKDNEGNIGLTYIKSLKFVEKDKYKDLFLSKYINNIANTSIINVNRLDDFANKETICGLYNLTEYPLESNLIDLFKNVVNSHKDDFAIEYKNKKITYNELDIITDTIAKNLISYTTKKSNPIGILLSHDWKYVVSMLSILKAGKTYVPMSKLYPVERLQLINSIADLDGIIVDNTEEFNNEELKNKFIIFDNLIKSDKENHVYLPQNTYDNIAYIMFTSGSTGTPKGVRITHRNIINNAYFLNNKVFLEKKIEPKDYGVLAEFVFDMSVQQIYPALLFGKTLHIYPGDIAKTPQNMLDFFEKVDTSDATPIALRLVTDYIETQQKKNNTINIKYIHLVVGGEKLPYNLCDKYFGFCENNEITNIYGPTECTVEVTTFHLDKEIMKKLRDEVPIGYTVDNSRIYVLNDDNKMLPPKEVGEICVGGECVGKGYINNNSKSFCKDIMSNNTMYKTGDLGFFDEDGLLYYVGRNDRQVKVNGYRVDLGDIEKNLETTKYISEARVFYDKFNSDKKKLVAYVIGKNEDINLDDLLNDIRGKLPNYMIPSYFIQVKKFITNINGKLDFSKLPNISHALRIKEDKVLQYEENDIIANNIVEYLEDEFSCSIKGKSDCDLQALGCDSLGVFKFLAFIEEKYGISINHKSDIYTSKLSAIIDNVKECIEKNEDKSQEEYAYKKKYIALPMQNYLYNQECEIILNGNSNNFNAMMYMYELVDDVDEKLLEESIIEVIKGHDAFNMSFKCNGNICKITHNIECKYSIEYINYDKDINDIRQIVPIINYYDDILAYFYIVTTKEKKYLLTSIHHLIYDYMSSIFLIKDIENYYFNKQAKKSSFFRIIEKKNKERKSNEYINDLKYWEEYAKNISVLDNLKIPSTLDYEREVVCYNVTSEEFDRCSKNSGYSKFILYLGIFYSALFSVTKQEKLTIGTFLNGRDNIFPTTAIGFLSKYIPFTFESEGELSESTFSNLKDSWNEIKKYESSADIEIILNNMVQSSNVMFDYQVMYNIETTNKLYTKIHTCENIQDRFALTYKLYEYYDKLAVQICYSKNNKKETVDRIKKSFEKSLQETLKNYLGYEREDIV